MSSLFFNLYFDSCRNIEYNLSLVHQHAPEPAFGVHKAAHRPQRGIGETRNWTLVVPGATWHRE